MRVRPASSLLLLPLLLLLLLSSPSPSSSFYLPGVAPRDYEEMDPINVKVIKLDSVKTQLPYDYYSLPFCRPKEIVEVDENLGEVLSGDQIENSPYTVYMKHAETCRVLCVKDYTDEEMAQFAAQIEDEYRVNWLLDNIPAATKYYTVNVQPAEDGKAAEPIEHYEKGYALGFVGHKDFLNSVEGVKYINNHLRLNIKHHHEDVQSAAASLASPIAATLDGTVGGGSAAVSGGSSGSATIARIVGFEIEAYSVHHVIDPAFTYDKAVTTPQELDGKLITCSPNSEEASRPQRVSDFKADDTEKDRRVIFTYDVQWEQSNIKSAHTHTHSQHTASLPSLHCCLYTCTSPDPHCAPPLLPYSDGRRGGTRTSK